MNNRMAFAKAPKGVNAERAQYVRSSSDLITIVMMTFCCCINLQMAMSGPSTDYKPPSGLYSAPNVNIAPPGEYNSISFPTKRMATDMTSSSADDEDQSALTLMPMPIMSPTKKIRSHVDHISTTYENGGQEGRS